MKHGIRCHQSWTAAARMVEDNKIQCVIQRTTVLRRDGHCYKKDPIIRREGHRVKRREGHKDNVS